MALFFLDNIVELKDSQKGIIFGIIATLLIGLQPIVANARPEIIDPFIYAGMTVVVEALVFFPVMMVERHQIKRNRTLGKLDQAEAQSLLHGYKGNKLLLLFVGTAFGFGQILFFVGYRLAGSINGSLAQKSTIFFSLLFGAVLLKEKVTKLQLFFSAMLFFGLILAVTQGTFNLLELNIGVIILLILSSIWMFAHTMTKPLFDRKEAMPSQMVFIRNAIGGIILFSVYFMILPIETLNGLSNPLFLFWGLMMGITYGTGLYFWYKTLQHLEVGRASILVSPTPIATAIYATIFLGEMFTIFQFMGTLIVIGSIIMIVKPSKKRKKPITPVGSI
jgi:drug/metabolite transporter (DMT)-like permease